MLNTIYTEQFYEMGTMKTNKGIANSGTDDQDEVVDPTLLVDHDSCFCDFKGVRIHHKIRDGESQTHSGSHQNKKFGFPMILLHGFGASVFSWELVMKPLAEVTGTKVLAFDRPAFGLTSRGNLSNNLSSRIVGDKKPLNPYSTAFSVLATLCFLDLLRSDKAILMGHSAGSVVAVNAYFEAPERVAALILVAPAIFAPLTISNTPKIVTGNQSKQDNNKVYKIVKYIADAITQMMMVMIHVLYCFFGKIFIAVLRSSLALMMIRIAINKFGIAILRNAWFDPNKMSDHIIGGYTKPLRIKDWDKALVEFTAALLLDDKESEPECETKPSSIRQSLHEISCPVLIVSGDSDRIVPSWNSEGLSRAIPGATFEVIKECGHLPHEEKVDEFVSLVQNFLVKKHTIN